MTKLKTSIALDEDLLEWMDTQIEKRRFANRTHAVEYALQQLIDHEKTVAVQKSQILQSKARLVAAESISKYDISD